MNEFDVIVRGGARRHRGRRRGMRHRDPRRAHRRSREWPGKAPGGSSTRPGRTVTPGGVDAHCHLDQRSLDGSVCADDFYSGTRSAAAGGTTTVVPFAIQFRGESLRWAVDDYHRRAEGRAVVDYAFHLIVTDPNPQICGQELPALVRDGYSSLKIYMTYDDLKLDDGQILEVLAAARRTGGMVMVHAENAECIGWLTDRLEEAGRIEPRYHATSRPRPVEREATHRAISLSEILDVPILLVHVSAREAAWEIRRAQGRGLKVFGETCPQYLFLTEDDLDRPEFEGAKCICSPPPRDRENQEVIWDGLRNGTFQVFSSDHSPTRFDDPKGKADPRRERLLPLGPERRAGARDQAPPPLFRRGRQGADRPHVLRRPHRNEPGQDSTASIPARGPSRWGRTPTSSCGDDEREVTIRNELLHHDVDYTPYEGMRIRGWPGTVALAAGRSSGTGEKVSGAAGRGTFLPCDRPEAAAPLGRTVVAELEP